MKKVLVVLLVILLLGAAIGGFFIYRHASATIGRNEATQIALNDAGLERNQVYDLDVDYEHGWYEVDFESAQGEFSYRIDARTGEILTGGID
ncbi:MAG: PepSY domain-containing protein [Oscillospiraceae bacterium]|nr:PepSY domain-containing protein [Oscillospiraceae bacterium]MBO5638837.1 PepSY domain-containing protein [Oscillospiraceae bacterium]